MKRWSATAVGGAAAASCDVIGEVLDRIGTGRLVTLIGPGGVGNTRLALESAHRLATAFPDGVVLCDLTAATSRDEGFPAAPTVAAVVVAALDIEGRVDEDDLRRLSEVRRHDRTLLVLDNCEHVLTRRQSWSSTCWADRRHRGPRHEPLAVHARSLSAADLRARRSVLRDG